MYSQHTASYLTRTPTTREPRMSEEKTHGLMDISLDDAQSYQSEDQEDRNGPNILVEESRHCRQPTRHQFRRPRAGRACGSCHSRRIRCDAGSLGLPCTNCRANSTECFIPPKKKKKAESGTPGDTLRRRHRARLTQDSASHQSSPEIHSSSVLIEDNLQSLKDEWAFTGLYAEIARQNETDNFLRKGSTDMKIECIQNISQRLASDYRAESSRCEGEGEGEEGLMFSPEDASGEWMDERPKRTSGIDF